MDQNGDESMEISQGSGRMREKRVNNFAGTSAKKIRSSGSYGGGIEERDKEGSELKIILRFGKEKENSSVSPVKLFCEITLEMYIWQRI